MVYFLKHFKGIAYFLIMLILFQSCIVYKKNPSTIEKASSKNNIKMKILTKDGQKHKFRWIEEKDGNVYSIANTKRVFIKKSNLGESNFKHNLINIESQGDYIRGLKITNKDTTTVLIPIEQIEELKLINKGLSYVLPIALSFLIIISGITAYSMENMKISPLANVP